MKRSYRKITHEERLKIAELYEQGLYLYQIANRLDRPLSSVVKEIDRGYTGQTDKNRRRGYSVALSEERLAKNISKRGFATSGQPKRQKQSEEEEWLEGQESFFAKK